MKQNVLAIHPLKTVVSHRLFSLLQISVGSIFLGLMAQVAIPLPFTPVPFSLQTLAVLLLAISLGSRKAPGAVLMYLMQAILGLPVLAGGVSNPLWLAGPKAGYLVGFVIASYLIAKLLERQKNSSFIRTCAILSLGEGFILLLGSLWLGAFVEWKNAFLMGLYPFLPGALIKVILAAAAYPLIKNLKSKGYLYLNHLTQR